ncbi:MAG: hypothetical protein AAF429_04500 [Pseudomonadota bacterium]
MTYPIDLSQSPEGYGRIADDPEFDPSVHLALEVPDTRYTLADLGYREDQIAECPSDFAATSVFRVLSEEGAACLYTVCKQLEAYTSSNPRIERCTRGGVYRSRFLRDLCLSPDVASFMSELAGVDLMPHTIPHQLGHLNYNPSVVGGDVDKWHVDTLRYDYVMFVTDPTKVKGGAFQYFRGTKEEIAEIKSKGDKVPNERVIAPEMPGPGYAVLQQGNMVVHQAKGLEEEGERITMVNGYVADPKRFEDFTRYDQLTLVDPPEVVTAEYARHIAVLNDLRLNGQLGDIGFQADPMGVADRLEHVARSLSQTAKELRDTQNVQIEHFGD